MSENMENLTVDTGLDKANLYPSFQFQFQGTTKECSNHCTMTHISHASDVLLKVF